MEQILDAVKLVGPWCAVALFFIWQATIRESRFAAQIEKSEAFIRETLNGVIAENTEAMLGLKEILKTRPCLQGDKDLIAKTGGGKT